MRTWLSVTLVALWCVASVGGFGAQGGAGNGNNTETLKGASTEWRYIGGNDGSSHSSSAALIDSVNVKHLRIAWRRPGVADELRVAIPDLRSLRFGNNRATPLMINGVLYSPNSIGLVEAFSAATGATVWLQELPEGQPAGGQATRGVAYWQGGSDQRIFSIRNSHLWALDAKTGSPIAAFGDKGKVDLRTGLGPVGRAMLMWNFAPSVCEDVVMVGVGLNDNIKTKTEPPGLVQAFDVRSGAVRWTFNPVPRPGEAGNETWENDSWSYSGAANVWSLMSVDEELGLAYLPTGSATSDMYGGHRLGSNLFANSLVCVKCATGEKVWHFQTIHHDLWDWDNNVAPILANISVQGRSIKAVVQLTKQAMAYVFDRATGAPVWPIEERPVPTSDTPGERTSSTQPFPTKPAPFDRHGVSIDDLIDFTPQLRAEAVEIVSKYRIGPIFTPPSIKGGGPDATNGTLQVPGETGGAQYTGAAFDPSTSTLFVPSITGVMAADLVPGDVDSGLRYVRGTRERVIGPRGLPLLKPPYGRIVAIDMNTGDQRWMVANADGPRDHPALSGLTVPPLGQPTHDRLVVTPTLLLSAQGDVTGEAATPPFGGAGSSKLRAYDKASGAVISEIDLPAGATGGILTYISGGVQYIVLPIGAPNHPSEIIALTVQ